MSSIPYLTYFLWSMHTRHVPLTGLPINTSTITSLPSGSTSHLLHSYPLLSSPSTSDKMPAVQNTPSSVSAQNNYKLHWTHDPASFNTDHHHYSHCHSAHPYPLAEDVFLWSNTAMADDNDFVDLFLKDLVHAGHCVAGAKLEYMGGSPFLRSLLRIEAMPCWRPPQDIQVPLVLQHIMREK